MKTQATTTDSIIASSLFTKMHALMAIAGVVIAIVCSLILFRGSESSSHTQSGQSLLIETSKSAVNHELVKATDLSIILVQSLLK